LSIDKIVDSSKLFEGGVKNNDDETLSLNNKLEDCRKNSQNKNENKKSDPNFES